MYFQSRGVTKTIQLAMVVSTYYSLTFMFSFLASLHPFSSGLIENTFTALETGGKGRRIGVFGRVCYIGLT